MLVQLPTEVLETIVKHITYERDINSLARSCQCLYGKLNSVLLWRNHLLVIRAILDEAIGAKDNDTISLIETRLPNLLGSLQDYLVRCYPATQHSALAWAAQKDTLQTISKALSAGIDVAFMCSLESLIHVASENDSESVLRLLLSLDGTDINCKDKYGHTALHSAAKANALRSATILIASEADQSIKCLYGESALHLAARSASVDVMKLLIQNGADICARRMDLCTPLSCASEQKHLAPVELLLRLGADPNVEGVQGLTALMRAAKTGSPEVIRLLRQYGAKTGATLTDGRLALDIAADAGNISTLKALLHQSEADLLRLKRHGLTSLIIQCRKGNRQIVELLLEHGADADVVAVDGRSALSQAVVYRQADILKLLLQHGAKVNLTNHDGVTALALAVTQRDVDTVQLLLEYGADPHLAASDGRTPVDVARHIGENDIARLILEYHSNQLM